MKLRETGEYRVKDDLEIILLNLKCSAILPLEESGNQSSFYSQSVPFLKLYLNKLT